MAVCFVFLFLSFYFSIMSMMSIVTVVVSHNSTCVEPEDMFTKSGLSYLFLSFYFFKDRIFPCNSPGCPGTCLVNQAGLELTISACF